MIISEVTTLTIHALYYMYHIQNIVMKDIKFYFKYLNDIRQLS